jgi:hypothetical protein
MPLTHSRRHPGLYLGAVAILLGTSSRAQQPARPEVPNLIGLTAEQARAAVTEAKLGAELEVWPQRNAKGELALWGTLGACPSVVGDRVIELGQICKQSPDAGPQKPFAAARHIQVVLQTEDPRHGRVGTPVEWHLMPKLVGLPQESALAKMREAGFTDSEKVHIQEVDEAGCEAGRVCRTYPEGNNRAGQHSDKVLYIGKR